MRAVIPYKKKNAKSRLSPVFSLEEREELVELMLKDVYYTLSTAGIEDIDILTTPNSDITSELDANIIENENDLNSAINSYLFSLNEPVMIVMADLPLITPTQIMDIMENDADILIVPGKGGGTNILKIKNPVGFHVKYYGSSYNTHCSIAQQLARTVEVYDSFRASTDIDEPSDLVELMIHGTGLAKEYINNKFITSPGKGRVAILADTCKIVSE
ncbi:2-phospho-L-lactate guanylyltransferase [Methanosalsum natronophilum]|uniref:2-phospho-L-lactate guanylyltransferase n=1 Tax=Methanosalsum natronophilum TaxID=768733 RepID=A0A3R7X541_9EURY|nr:2-phospho-L-lactate guanylyltransferase [Methanosalsum natronophilum]MCS3923208.1 2-phospho-L-lactate guanylyltransferase [Methanosalsum natronophilum]RQD82239.1 MAG: 2-phospho-L-lactate guanylyltransferase [Methanosalsum natronophilum]